MDSIKMARSTSSFRKIFTTHDDSSISRVGPPCLQKKKKQSSQRKSRQQGPVPLAEELADDSNKVIIMAPAATNEKKSIEITYEKYLEIEKYLQEDGKLTNDEIRQDTRESIEQDTSSVLQPVESVLKEVREAMEVQEKEVAFNLENNQTKIVTWKTPKPTDSPGTLNLKVPPPVKYGLKTEFPATEIYKDTFEFDELTDSESADSDDPKGSAKLTAPPRRMARRESSNPFKKTWSEVCAIAKDIHFVMME